MSSASPRSRCNSTPSVLPMALPRDATSGRNTPQKSPRSQAAIDKCMAALENCKAVLAQSAENGSSHDDDLIMRELFFLASQGQGSLSLAAGSPYALLKSPTYIPRGVAFEIDTLRWDDCPVVVETSGGMVKEKMRDASWENASWEAQGGRPRVFRTPYRWPKPSAAMLLEVEARGC